MAIWLVVFFLTPIVEMYLLIQVGGQIGALPTIALVMLTAVIGVVLLGRQGLSTLTRGMGRLQNGELPAQEMAEGLLLAIAGVMLMVPGFVTDATGLLLMLPFARSAAARGLLRRAAARAEITTAGVRRSGPPRPRRDRDGFLVIEGEYEERNDPPPDKSRPGP